MVVEPSELDPIGRIADSFAERYRRGERPSVEEYARDFPELASELRDLLPAVVLMEEAKRDCVGAASGLARVDDGALATTLERLGDYRIVREIGRGGMGVVYEAEQVSLGRRVALKVLPSCATLDPKRLKRFHREARSVASLHHTNIVPVYGIGQADGTHYFVMQYLPGQGLDKVIQELGLLSDTARSRAMDDTRRAQPGESATDVALSLLSGEHRADPRARSGNGADGDGRPDRAGPKPPATSAAPPARTSHYWRNVARIGFQVADALEYAHNHGTCHRDIKPSNLLLDRRGTTWVTDFGLAKPEGPDELTQSGELMGTLRYMAPELLQGRCDPRSDIYSLGLTLYELVALSPARDASSWSALVDQVRQGRISPLRKRVPRTPRDLETIIHKATAPDPQRRYGTAGEMAADLQRFLNDEPIRARRVGYLERARRWCRRNPLVSFVSAMSLLVIVATVAVAFVLVDQARQRALLLAHEQSRLAAENADLAEQERRSRGAVQQSLARESQQRRRAEQLMQDAQRARDEQQRASNQAKAVSDFLVLDMIGMASPTRNLGRQLTVRDMLDRAARRVATVFADQPPLEAAVREAIGRAYHHLGAYHEAQEHYAAALRWRYDTLGPEHRATLTAMANLGTNYHKQGKHAEALRLQEESLRVARRVFGPDDSQTLQSLGNLAATLHVQGKPAESQQLLEEALERKNRLLGPEHESTLTTLVNLAVNYADQKKYAEAQALHEKALAIKRRCLGERAPGTLTSMTNLAIVLDRQGKHAEAVKLYEECLDASRRVLGADHPNTLSLMNNLAVSFERQARHDEAAKLLEEAGATARRLFGDEHPIALAAANNLATSLLDQGDLESIETGLEDAAEAATRALGPEHPMTLGIQENLARLLVRQGRFLRAWEIYGQVFSARKLDIEAERQKLLTSMEGMAAAALRGRRFSEAETLLAQVLEIQRRTLGPEHIKTLQTRNFLGATHLGQGRYYDAEQGFRELLPVSARLFGPEKASTLCLMVNLSVALARQGRLAEAKELLQKVLAAPADVLPSTSPLREMAEQLSTSIDNDRDSQAKGPHASP